MFFGCETGNGSGAASAFLGAWVSEDWDANDYTAFIFKDDSTVTWNGFLSGTYNSNTMTFTSGGTATGNIEISGGNLVVSNFSGDAAVLNGTYAKGGLLTLTNAPTGCEQTNYRVYIRSLPWESSTTENLMTADADPTIQAFAARTPGGTDIADGTLAPLFWTGTKTGTYHVLICQGGNGLTSEWKYKNDVVFADGNNTTSLVMTIWHCLPIMVQINK
ncbi:MAG: hypothetical protein LBQ46_03670 [Treponema sp.]|nr:hypothetical protein [Treponema sp.]